jgi:hypothetical protein
MPSRAELNKIKLMIKVSNHLEVTTHTKKYLNLVLLSKMAREFLL